jgi:hypothetical protein
LASALNNIGAVYRSWGQYDKAIENYQQALTIARKLGIEDKIAIFLSNIGVAYYFGMVYYGQQQYDPAIKYLAESINILEKLRKTATGNARRDYLASQVGNYRALISLYLLNQEAAKAFEAMEQGRSRLLAERLADSESKLLNLGLSSMKLNTQFNILSMGKVGLFFHSVSRTFSVIFLTMSGKTPFHSNSRVMIYMRNLMIEMRTGILETKTVWIKNATHLKNSPFQYQFVLFFFLTIVCLPFMFLFIIYCLSFYTFVYTFINIVGTQIRP